MENSIQKACQTMNSMKKSKRKLYEGEVLKDYRELVNRYKSRYANNVAFEYRHDVHDEKTIKVTYAHFS